MGILMIIGIIVASWVLLAMGWVIYNLYSKNYKFEQIIVNQSNFIKSILQLADSIDKTVQKIDSTLWVSGDQELKQLFNDVKIMQENIQQFTKKL
jgi:biopolymer transport protein ExbB/TolQ